ncbi:MAG TPA: universal stress protein [Halomonas sp.]|nr:universal stress protein [Halomonas sp.]
MNIQHMLVVIDPTRENIEPCLERAEQLAAEHPQARFTLFMCDFNSALEGGVFFESAGLEKARASLLEHRRSGLEQMAKPLREKGFEVTIEVVWGKRLSRHILTAVSKHKPDLVLKTTHHHNLLKRLLLSNSDWDLIRHCEVPVWLVKKAGDQLTKLAVSVDPLHEADKPAALDLKLIACGRSLAEHVGAELHLLHCYNPLPRTLVFDASVIHDYDTYANDVRERHANAFNGLAGSNEITDMSRHLLQGYPEEAIPVFVEQQGINLLVMGAISRSRLDSALLGHTAERLLDECACDILVIKPEGFVDPSQA